MNKTLKVRFFGPHLRALASLYKWKGPSKWNYGKGGKGKTAEDEEESQDAEVRLGPPQIRILKGIPMKKYNNSMIFINWFTIFDEHKDSDISHCNIAF